MPEKRNVPTYDIAPAASYEQYSSGANTFTYTAQAVFVETTGDVALVLLDDTTGDTISSVPAGTLLPIQCNGTAAATTATLVALYSE